MLTRKKTQRTQRICVESKLLLRAAGDAFVALLLARDEAVLFVGGPADLLLGLTFKLDGLRLGRKNRVALGQHLAREIFELLVDDEAVRGREAGYRVDGEGTGYNVLLPGLGFERLGVAGVPVLDRVVGDEQGVLFLGIGRVGHEEVGLVARAATAAVGRHVLGQGVAAFLDRLLLLFLRLVRQLVIALAQFGRTFVDLDQIGFDPDVLVHVLVF